MSNPIGRPTIYTEDLANEICRLIMEGDSLRKICASGSMPNRSTVHEWLANNHDFADQYVRARELQGDTYADEIVEIADTATDKDSAAAAKVRTDARKWVASKLKPKKYGDKLDLDANISGNLTIQTVNYSDANNTDSV